MAIKILGVITEDINIGDIFTTENSVLTSLGFPKSSGNTRIAYIKESKRYLNWESTGKLYRGKTTSEVVITEKYDTPKEKQDKRFGKKKDIMIKFKVIQNPKVYKYVNKNTLKVDYVGIIWGKNRKIKRRIFEHESKDGLLLKNYDIYYFNVKTRFDAEVWEGHLISYYETKKRLNKYKAKWGLCTFLNGLEDSIDWIKYEVNNK